MTAPVLSFVTPSYRDDYELAVALCRSLDSHVRGAYEHLLIVPNRDLPLFEPLAAPHRRVIGEDSILKPLGIRRLPIPTRLRLPGLGVRKIRQQYWCSGVGRISGWVMQQLLKLSVPGLARSDLMMFVDSDVVLFRPLDVEALAASDAVKVHRTPMRPELVEHQRWYRSARRLLGLPSDGPIPYNYIGNLVPWRRDIVRAMLRDIEQHTGLPWHRAVAREGTISEYILYGVYCAERLQWPAGAFEPSRLVLCYWSASDAPSAQTLRDQLRPEHVALHMQSTLPMTPQARQELLMQAAVGAR